VTMGEPTTLCFMLDQSNTMKEMPDGVKTKFAIAEEAVVTFINDPISEGANIALQYFPSAGDCNSTGYDTPEVPIGRLRANALQKVNVQFSPTGKDTDKQIIGMVAAKDRCGLSGGWYYDSPTSPTQIVACDCSSLSRSLCAKVLALKGLLMKCRFFSKTP
jgi:hypothetical protein